MGSARQPAEQRWFPRYHPVAPTFKGRLSFAIDGRSVEARLSDVSRDGLGVVLSELVKPGETLNLVFAEREIGMVVIWCIPDLIHKGSFRAGLHRRNGSSENLVSLFAAHGIIDPT
jgi:hypothetical protein